MPSTGDSLKLVVDSLQQLIHVHQSESELVRKVTWFAMIPFIAGFAFVIFVVYRARREALFRQKEAELNRQISEVEMKALRSQLNPHFIFNCLNSIHQFVRTNDNASAGNYLVKFSKLMRLVLENSTHHEVSLREDLDALTMYIEMEQLRMQNNFTFAVTIDKGIDAENVLVPPLIVQPFVENSIWHGLNGKPNDGKLDIEIKRSGEYLQYIVRDNGVLSTSENAPVEGKRKSLGLSLTRERLEVLNKTRKFESSFNVEDLKNENGSYAGKKVVLNLPYVDDTL